MTVSALHWCEPGVPCALGLSPNRDTILGSTQGVWPHAVPITRTKSLELGAHPTLLEVYYGF